MACNCSYNAKESSTKIGFGLSTRERVFAMAGIIFFKAETHSKSFIFKACRKYKCSVPKADTQKHIIILVNSAIFTPPKFGWLTSFALP
jgi:hypothetical protein